jgi:hypothetical protein
MTPLVPVTTAAPLPVPASPQSAGPGGAGGAGGAGMGGLFASPLGSPTGVLPMHLAGPLRPASFSPVTNLRDNPPCNTLFM